MNTRRILLLTLLTTLGLVPRLHAQLVSDGATATLTNVTNIITGEVVVGTNGSFTLLVLSNNVLLTNSVNGVIGLNLAAKSNEVQLISPTARWRMGGFLFVGSNGASSRLVVSDGAFVENNNASLARSAASSNNFALVTGSGSVWSNRNQLDIGGAGPDNRMIVSNAGWVVSSTGILGRDTSSSNNLVLVTGSGSVWSNALNLGVGNLLPGNRLVIEAGGLVSCQSGSLGGSVNAMNNEALVTGPGSLFSVGSFLTLGSAFNRLVVSNGAAVKSLFGLVGTLSTAVSNQVVVTGAGSMWNNESAVSLGRESAGNRVEVSDGGWLVCSNADIGDGIFANNNTVVLTGMGSGWNNLANLVVGEDGSGNVLIASNRATAFVGGNSILGKNSGAHSNSVLVTGLGTRWQIASNLYLGSNGAFNRLVVSNGGFVGALRGDVGSEPTASNNVALVTGSGSVWSNSSFFLVGSYGDGNQLVLTNGGSLICREGIIGGSPGSDNNLAVVTGPGSAWNNADGFYVGYHGFANRLVVSNAGRVVNGRGVIGVSSRSNEVLVTGTGSFWSNRLDVLVGEFGSANRLLVNNGGTVFGSNVFVGAAADATNNRVVVGGGTLRAANAAGTSVLDVRRGTNVLNAGLVDVDQLVLTNKGIALPQGFGNSSSNRIPSFDTATQYPSIIPVTGLVGAITKVTVTLSNLTHPDPGGLDILLVSPTGQKVMLMSDAGGVADIVNVRLTFDDSAAVTLPTFATPITTGTYQPTDHPPGETMPVPAPGGPYSTNLSSFNGSNPNGSWSLHINNAGGSSGFLHGWGVQIITDEGPTLDSGVFEFNGGTLVTRGAFIDNARRFVVGGPGGVPAVWDVRAGVGGHFVAHNVIVGRNSSFNQLIIRNGGNISADPGFIVGENPMTSTNNLLQVAGGTLGAGTFDIRGGTNRLDAGLVDVERLVVTNARGQFEFNSGTLRTLGTTVANGRVFTVGNGLSLATLQLLGGTHTFANNLVVANNGSLIGNGIISGTVTVSAGGRLVPGAPIGRIDVLGTVILQGAVNLQIDKSGGVRTNDQVSASGAIFYSGALNVTDIGTDVLAAGDRFPLFNAAPYVGAFTTISLPPLGPGLAWRNNLLVDGSIEVIATAGQPGFASISLSGTNVVFTGTNGTPGANYAVLTATNVALPLANWTSIATRQFDASGGFSFTNAIVPGIPQRFFRLRTP